MSKINTFKRNFLFTILYFICIFSCTSQDIFFNDSSAISIGKDSVLHFHCNYFFNFFTGSKDSVVTVNTVKRESEQFNVVAMMKNKTMNGPIYFYTGDSVLFMKGFMKNGKADSTFIGYQVSMKNYKKKSFETNYKNGLKDGQEIEYNEKENFACVRHYKEGNLDGLFTRYDDFGNKISEGPYLKGKKNETWLEADPDKRVAIYQKYKSDKLINYVWTSSFEDGKLFIKGTYDKKGLKQGIFNIYDPDGSVKSSETYRNGKRNGYYTEYFNGEIVRKVKYKNDRIAN